jgi:cobalt-zinc-cadmium resistance protein CzcA
VFVEDRSYNVVARFIGSSRNDPEAIGNLTLTAANGAHVALAQVAHIRLAEGETTITREMNKRHLTVRLNLRGRDLSSFLEEARTRIDKECRTTVPIFRWHGAVSSRTSSAPRHVWR